MPIAAACAQVMRAARAQAGPDADLVDVVVKRGRVVYRRGA